MLITSEPSAEIVRAFSARLVSYLEYVNPVKVSFTLSIVIVESETPF